MHYLLIFFRLLIAFLLFWTALCPSHALYSLSGLTNFYIVPSLQAEYPCAAYCFFLLSLTTMLNLLQCDFSMGNPLPRPCAQLRIKPRRSSSFLVFFKTSCSTKRLLLHPEEFSLHHSEVWLQFIGGWLKSTALIASPKLTVSLISCNTS